MGRIFSLGSIGLDARCWGRPIMGIDVAFTLVTASPVTVGEGLDGDRCRGKTCDLDVRAPVEIKPCRNEERDRVPALHINGGGTATQEDAQRECLDTIAFALEGDPNEYDSATHAIALEVSVAPTA